MGVEHTCRIVLNFMFLVWQATHRVSNLLSLLHVDLCSQKPVKTNTQTQLPGVSYFCYGQETRLRF